jgi:peptidoglycan/xylan/chitin deacetylase (PgdA/CDA1 family)
MFWIKPPALLGQVFREAWWRIPCEDQAVCITFDDGPHPETTPFILEQLESFGMTATFFCLGRCVEAHPALLNAIREAGHGIGIHGWNHLSGWHSSFDEYLTDLHKAAALIQSPLFRPPYGKLSWRLWKALKDQYQVVMWTTSPEDYKPELDPGVILERLTRSVRAGDIVVLHENDKSKEHIKSVLPAYLDWLKAHNFTSRKINPDNHAG